MGLMPSLRRKAHTWYWRGRHWWYDTRAGAIARAAALVLVSLTVTVQMVRMTIAASAPAAGPHVQVQHAYGLSIIVVLIILLIIAAAVYASMPKVESQKPQQSNPPSTDDGQAVIDILGTGWIEDYFVLAWKPNGVQKIKAKGKK